MWILALETTSAHGSVALLRGGEVIGARELEARQYASGVFQVTAALLAEAQLELGAIGLFAVASGPGSFTGVRIGLTAVKGWVEALGTPAVSVSSLRAVAGAGTGPALAAPVLAALDASRGDIYYGVYPGGADSWQQSDEGLEPAAAFRRRCQDLVPGWRAFTPHPELLSACPELELVSPMLAPAVGRLGAARFRTGHLDNALTLDASYIRRADAELNPASALERP